MQESERKQSYNCDVTYVANQELGFDFLRDNLAMAQVATLLQIFIPYVIILNRNIFFLGKCCSDSNVFFLSS